MLTGGVSRYSFAIITHRVGRNMMSKKKKEHIMHKSGWRVPNHKDV